MRKVVWLKLMATCGMKASGLEPPGHVRRQFRIAQLGYDDGGWSDDAFASDSPDQNGTQPDGRHQNGQADHRAALAPYFADRDQHVADAASRILDLLDVPEPREARTETLVALVEGLTLSACRGRLTPAQAVELATAHVRELRQCRGPSDRPG
jgi:hypothetical protein